MENDNETKLTPAQKSEKKLLVDTFKGQLTENALNDLRVRFPSDVVLDMTNDEVFKQGRKDRTECNKLVENINSADSRYYTASVCCDSRGNWPRDCQSGFGAVFPLIRHVWECIFLCHDCF